MMTSKHVSRVALIAFIFICGSTVVAQVENGEAEIAASDPPAAAGAMAPKLTAIDENSALLTWLEPAPMEASDGKNPSRRSLRLCCSRFENGKWTPPRTIVQREDFFANWADVPSIVQAADGSLIAHWLQKSGEAPYAYDVMLARSADGGETWKTLGKLHDDNTQTEHGFVSLVREANGVRAFWLDGREMKSAAHAGNDHGHGGGNMTLRTSRITGETVAPSHVLDVRVCECCNTSAAVSHQGPLIVYRDRSEQDTRDIFIVRNVDGKWTNPRPVHDDDWQISACPVNGPAVAARGATVAVAWFTSAQQQPRVRLSFSRDAGATFATPVEIDDREPLGRVALAMDISGAAIVCWLASENDKAAIRLVRVQSDGTRGKTVTVAHTSAARSSGFPTIALAGNRVLVVWTEAGRPSALRAALVELKKHS